MIVLDDTGFGNLGCFGSPIETPNLDAIAASGLRYNNMHTTALCSPSRACIVTGRNHHSNGMACITELASGYPGYNGVMPFENGMLSEILVGARLQHLHGGQVAPDAEQPGDRGGPVRALATRAAGSNASTASSVATPASGTPISCTTTTRSSRLRRRSEGYHLSEDLVDKAVEFIADAKQIDPAKPFYLHLCFGATHAPHHVAKEWADKYSGAFDDGWFAYRERTFARQKELGIVPPDAELSRNDPDVPDWDSLPSGTRKLFSRFMEVFAGFLTFTDVQIGRLLAFLTEIGELDNTLIMVVSDNGASAEGGPSGTTNEAQFFNNAQESIEDSLALIDEIGGPKHFNHYPWGWTWAGNTPFRRWKRETYRGGVSDPFIVSWPSKIRAKGEIRTQYAHIIDMVPTVLDRPRHRTARLDQGHHPGPDARRELRPHLRRPGRAEQVGPRSTSRCSATEPSTTTAGEQYVRGQARRSPKRAWGSATRSPAERLSELDATGWELYHVAEDFAENHNVAARAPRPADRDDRHVVRRGRQVRRHAHRRQRPRPDDRREADGVDVPRDRYVYRPEHAVDLVLRGSPGAQSSAQHHRRRRDPRRRRRGCAALTRLRGRRLHLLHQRRHAAIRPQLRRPSRVHRRLQRTPCPRGAISSGSSSSPRVHPT